MRCARRVPSETTQDFTRWKGSTPYFTWNASRAVKKRSTYDGCRSATPGRFLFGIRGGARVPASDEDAVSGDCGCDDACRGNFSQPDDRGHSKVLSGACTEDHECDLVAGAGDVYEGDRRGGPRREYPQLQRG